MKRILAGVLVLLLVFSLAACSEWDDGQNEETSIQADDSHSGDSTEKSDDAQPEEPATLPDDSQDNDSTENPDDVQPEESTTPPDDDKGVGVTEKTDKSQNEDTSEPQKSEIIMTVSDRYFKGMNYKTAEQKLREIGFTNFEYRTIDTKTASEADTICYVDIIEFILGDSDFDTGDKFDPDSTVSLVIYKYDGPSSSGAVFYSTNDYDTATKGNTGVFSYKNSGASYDIYWIVDFDEGYVYNFTDGNGDTYCDRIKIDSGTLNDTVTITYHDGGVTWSYYLHFKYVKHPETLIVVDQNGFDYKYSTTNLNAALSLMASKNINDY